MIIIPWYYCGLIDMIDMKWMNLSNKMNHLISTKLPLLPLELVKNQGYPHIFTK